MLRVLYRNRTNRIYISLTDIYLYFYIFIYIERERERNFKEYIHAVMETGKWQVPNRQVRPTGWRPKDELVIQL